MDDRRANPAGCLSHALIAIGFAVLSGSLAATMGWWLHRNNNFDGGFYAAVFYGAIAAVLGGIVAALITVSRANR